MILEALNYAASWPLTPAAFRPYLSSSVNLWSRARRCAADWEPHEIHCRATIEETVSLLSQRRSCVVLGSGLLRDVPIAELSRAFDTVILVDLVHLATVRMGLAFRGLRNVRLISRDLLADDPSPSGEAAEPLAFLRQVPYLDLVISANLLSQLGIGQARRLDRTRPDLGEDERKAILKSVIARHLEGLRQLPSPAQLITDIRFDILDRTGRREDGVDLMHGVPLPEEQASWDWMVAPMGESAKNYALRHRVMVHLFNAPRRQTS